jgi:biotin operon repressor
MKKINVTLEQFIANIRRHAETLKRHGLYDPAERTRGYRKPKKAPELLPSLPDLEDEI